MGELRDLVLQKTHTDDPDDVLDVANVMNDPALQERVGHTIMDLEERGDWPTHVESDRDGFEIHRDGRVTCTGNWQAVSQPGRRRSPDHDPVPLFDDNCTEFEERWFEYKIRTDR